MTNITADGNKWENIVPQVNSEAEFLEIVHDFGDPLEVLREAISNAIDWGASWIKIGFDVEEIEGNKRLVLTMFDNGVGMTREVISRDFWGLGYSPSRKRKDKVGEKGHGTKIFLRSESVTVKTQSGEGSYFSECIKPLSNLTKGQLHEPRLKSIENLWTHTGTEIKIVGYNDNERSQFVQDLVVDYLKWFTLIGSIEGMFGIDKHKDFKVFLKCLDRSEYEEIPFGHIFPEENSDIGKLFQEKGADAADWYVKTYKWMGSRLQHHPEVQFDVVISVEGDAIKRHYNKMIGERRRYETGRYRMSDRYGIWICKDYIPITRVNDWITGFGSGSNAFVLLHGFVNCQDIKLTANRGDVANTDPSILEELKTEVQKYIRKIDGELSDKGIYTLREWQEENRTLQQEKAEFDRRVKNLKGRKSAKLGNQLLIEPTNEAELSSLFTTVYSLHPELFEFEPLDYNANRGIDIIARNKSNNVITEGQHWYIELKHTLRNRKFNHAFEYLRWIVCWDFDKGIGEGTEFQAIEENDTRLLQTDTDDAGHHLYFLDTKKKARKIQIIRLKELLQEKLDLELKT